MENSEMTNTKSKKASGNDQSEASEAVDVASSNEEGKAPADDKAVEGAVDAADTAPVASEEENAQGATSAQGPSKPEPDQSEASEEVDVAAFVADAFDEGLTPIRFVAHHVVKDGFQGTDHETSHGVGDLIAVSDWADPWN